MARTPVRTETEIENERLRRELAERDRSLAEALAQQRATDEVLRIRGAADHQRLAQHAGRLCQAEQRRFLMVDADGRHLSPHGALGAHA